MNIFLIQIKQWTYIFNYTYFKDLKLIKKMDILKLRVVLTTEGSAGLLYMMGLKSGTFTHIFVDEAGQSMEPEMLIPLCMCLHIKLLCFSIMCV